MKKLMLFTFLMLVMLSFTIAQRSGERMKNRMQSYQIAFITEKLSLTPEESQKFWPIYNQYHEQTKKLRKEGKEQNSIGNMSDAEAEQYIKKNIEREEKELDLKKEFVLKLKGVLSPQKIARLQGLEKEFKKELLERVKERRQMKDNE